jgi:nucleotide-binding universal stress UspA family protein
LSIAVAMNARGGMGLIVAMVGLSLGILNQPMFSIIVVMAIVTSFMAPLGLQLTMRKVRMTEDELKRMAAEESIGALDPSRTRILIPTGGGPHAATAFRFAAGLCKTSASPADVVFIKAPKRLRDRIRNLLDNQSELPAETDIRTEIDRQLVLSGLKANSRNLQHRDVVGAVLEEARKSADVVVLGASNRGNRLGGPILEAILESSPCHVVIVKAGPLSSPDGLQKPFQSLLVPYGGGVFSRIAVEFAVRYAEATGASLTIALLDDLHLQLSGSNVQDLTRISPVFRAATIQPTVLDLSSQAEDRLTTLLDGQKYDLVVIGAENRALQHRLFFGYENERLINDPRVAAAIVVPNLSNLQRRDSTRA